MTRIYPIIIFLFFASLHGLIAQNNFVDLSPEDHFEKGVELFQDKKYNAAQNQFDLFLKSSHTKESSNLAQAQYYSALASIYLFHADGEDQVKRFVNAYPNHPQALEAYFTLGNFYYREKNYAKAVYYYELADESVLSKKDSYDFHFRLGYSYFSRQAFTEALPHLKKLKRSDNPYMAASHYYSAYINYELGNYNDALNDVKIASKTEAYENSTSEIEMGIYYQKGEYQKVLEYINSRDKARLPSAALLIAADTYFSLENYDQASEYFDAYEQKGGVVNERTLFYRVGYTNYQTGQINKAIENFEKVGVEKDSLTQYSTYYLGSLYSKNNELRYAINAFQQAKSLPFNKAIALESHWQLAALQIKQQNYEQSISELQSFLENYPASKYAGKAKELLTQAYLNTKAYGLAISFIESLPSKTSKMEAVYQKVCYYQGAEYYNAAKYFLAVQSFKKSINFPISKEILAQAYFWMAESFSTARKYKDALVAYEKALGNSSKNDSWYANLCYGAGYAYYNNKDYVPAKRYFQNYVDLKGNDLIYKADATIRLADCHYVTKSYAASINHYSDALAMNINNPDYVMFQLGVVNGLQGNERSANNYFDQLIKEYQTSSYYDNALFQKAMLTFEAGNYAKAVEQFKVLIDGQPNSNMVPYSLSKRATAYYNLKKYELALVDYRHILRRYITHPVASGALLGLQEINSTQNSQDDFEEFLAKYKQANPEDKEVVTIEYDAAKSLYFNQKYDKAVVAFKNYLENYPDNKLSEEAPYYLADSYLKLEDFDKAKTNFQVILSDKQSPFYKRSIAKMAEIELAMNQDGNAADLYKELLTLAESERDKYQAYSGLLKIAEQNNDHGNIIKYADLILDETRLNTLAVTQALLQKGMAYFNQGKYEDAKASFSKAIETAKDENAAESKYMIALMAYINKSYQKSLDLLFELNNTYSAYDKWIGKSFLLIADNYYAMGEIFQAKATLSSIIDNASSSQLIEEAKIKLEIIENKEQQEKAKIDSLQENMEPDSVIIESDTIQD